MCIILTSTVNASVIIHKIKYSVLQKQFFHVHRNKWMPNYTCCYGQNWSEHLSWLSVIKISLLIQIKYYIYLLLFSAEHKHVMKLYGLFVCVVIVYNKKSKGTSKTGVCCTTYEVLCSAANRKSTHPLPDPSKLLFLNAFVWLI